MNYFLQANKNFLLYSFVILLVIPIFGLKFILSFLGNIFLLFLLIPLLLLLLAFIGFNSYKSKINTCKNCGSISFNLNETCINCGADFKDLNRNKPYKNPSESTIEIKAEEVK